MENSFEALIAALDQIIYFLFSFASRNTLGEKRFHTPSEEDTKIWLTTYMYPIL
jgi:hypothetical protein